MYKLYHHPQQSCGKVMFLHLSVSLSVHRVGVHTTHAPLPCMSPIGMHTPHRHASPQPCTSPCHTRPPRYYEMRSMSGRYASYWNAFLFISYGWRSCRIMHIATMYEHFIQILGNESFARWLISLALALLLALALEIELALDIECYHITASVNHFTCPLPPHQSFI